MFKHITILILITGCNTSTGTKDLIIGSWQCEKRINYGPVKQTFNDTFIIFKFDTDGTIHDQTFEADEKTKYEIHNDTLVISINKYVIKKLNGQEMVLRQFEGILFEEEMFFKKK